MANQIELKKVSKDASIVTLIAPANTVNGSILEIGARQSNGTYTGVVPSAVTLLDLAMVLAVPLPYEADKVQNDFVIATNDLVRAYIPYKGFEPSIPQANITATEALGVGKVVVVNAASEKPECLAAPAGTETVVFEIIALETVNGVDMAHLRCVLA